MLTRLTAVLLLALCLSCGAFAQPVPDAPLPGTPAAAPEMPGGAVNEPRNPALLYWQAYAALRDAPEAARRALAVLTARDVVMDVAQPAELNAAFDGGGYERGLALYRRAAGAARAPDWGVDPTHGVFVELPHLRTLREMARTACWHARYAQAHGLADSALDDLLATLRMARRLTEADDATLLDLLVASSLESPATALLARVVPRLTLAQLRRVAAELATMPETLPLARIVRAEARAADASLGQYAAAYAATTRDPEQRARLIAYFADNMNAERWLGDYLTDPRVGELVRAKCDAVTAVLAQPPARWPARYAVLQRETTGASQLFTARLERLLTDELTPEPRAQFRRQGRAWALQAQPAFAKKLDALMEESNGAALQVAAMLVAAFGEAGGQAVQIIDQRAMLRAGVQVQLDNADILAIIPDPLVPKPFLYQRTEHGFRLTSAAQLDAAPISLLFGE